jgi:hypothetical protein
MTTLIFAHEYGPSDANDNRNFESLVIEMRTFKENYNGKILLDVLPRNALGYEFKIEIVSVLYIFLV